MTGHHLQPVMLSSRIFLISCALAAAGVILVSRFWAFPPILLAAEIFATIIGLFVFSSFRYRIHKNALAFGMAMVIVATFWGIWWPTSSLRGRIATDGWIAVPVFLQRHLLTWHGLDKLIHADTMVFILGLTLFVAVIAQTRLLETIAFGVLRRNKGYVLPTVISVAAVVAFSSGILDGVSMIGLTIRTLVLIMFLAKAPVQIVRYAVMVCTVLTTVCGIWLAYGEPPNLIMKANLVSPTGEYYLTNSFFLRYCMPGALASFLVIAWNLRRRLKGELVDLNRLDVLDAHAANLRFFQAMRHGEVITAIELLEKQNAEMGEALSERVQERVRHGEPMGVALIREGVPETTRKRILGEYVSEDLAGSLDEHYALAAAGDEEGARRQERAVSQVLRTLAPEQKHAQRMGIIGLVVFVGCLLWHSWDHRVPLFVASFAGFVISLAGIIRVPRMRRLALREARHEYAEYYFLFPLFLSIALLTKVGFFEHFQALLQKGTHSLGAGHVAGSQFLGCTLLSALLDNNVVADFGSRALLGFEVTLIHLFAMAQIAGYAIGGCWTHIGSAQSVVAYAFIGKEVDEHYTPMKWIKEMTPVIIEVAVVLTVLIYVESFLLQYLQ
jgi:Na+/H+ antiporter NhaD/arsenite permease-like protein